MSISQSSFFSRARIHALCESAIMLALAFVLSSLPLYEMPMGGSVTFASMLPIFLIAIKHGPRYGFPVAFLYAVTQLLQGLKNFAYAESFGVILVIALFDYLLPFTLLGLVSLTRRIKNEKLPRLGCYIGIFLSVLLRFACHFISGYVVWWQWAPEGMGPALYSFLYNGSFLLPEFGITLVIAVLLLEATDMQKILDIRE